MECPAEGNGASYRGWKHWRGTFFLGAYMDNQQQKGMQPPYIRLVDGALLPAPLMGDKVEWLKRPLSPGEVTNILKGFLQCSDHNLTSHSLKATTLSWAAKAGVPRDQRRILWRHAAAVQGADSFYSRDMSIGPVNSLQKVLAMIRDGIFHPDATRANYFACSPQASASTPAHVVMQPFTPAYLERTQPATPGIAPLTPRVAEAGQQPSQVAAVEAPVEIKRKGMGCCQ